MVLASASSLLSLVSSLALPTDVELNNIRVGNEQDILRRVCAAAQLSLPFHCTHKKVALWIIWESLCDAFYFLFFLFLFCFLLRANLMAHHCRCFREGMR